MTTTTRVGWALAAGLRVAIAGFAFEAVTAGDDPRFVGKGIAVRDIVLAGAALGVAVPLAHAVRHRGRPYPVWADVALLSILAVDMAPTR